MDKKQITKTLESLDFFILAIKASGGYKYRERIKGTDQEIAEYMAGAVGKFQKLTVSVLIAEEMLQERGYWDRYPRWQEYQERRDEAMKAVKK
jgi:hypothetical protein